jgi:hypothetical protein
MHISEKTTRKQLVEAAFTSSIDLFTHLGGAQAIAEMETEELREKITAWIMEGDEAGSITEEGL